MTAFTVAATMAFGLGAGEAQNLCSEHIDNEHIMLGLLKIEDLLGYKTCPVPEMDDREWRIVLSETTSFKKLLQSYDIDCKKSRRRLRRILAESMGEEKKFSGHRTDRCRKMFQLAVEISREEEDDEISLRHLIIAVLKMGSEPVERMFQELSVDSEFLLVRLSKRNGGKNDTMEESDGSKKPKYSENKEFPKDERRAKRIKPTPYFDQYGRDLTTLTGEGKLNQVTGRSAEMKKVIQVLIQKEKNNVLLVGDAGVGKTSIVEGLAQRLNQPGLPDNIKNFRIIEIKVSDMVAGARYRGDFEEKLTNIIKEASSDPNIILFIDEMHTLMGAGGGSGTALDASNMLKPALARGEIKCIGATTTEEYRKYIEKDAAFNRRFQLIWVDEPTREETLTMLKELKSSYEYHYGLKIQDDAVKKAVELSICYLTGLKLPGKAKDVIEKACSRKCFSTFSPGGMASESDREVTKQDICEAVSEMCRIPVGDLSEEESERLLKMEEYLEKRILGQGHAVCDVSETVRMAMAGLRDPKKPLGVFLFLGPTGVGKTEMAKVLTEFLFHDEKRLITIDMSEYQEKHSIAKLIGAPPGYIGYNQEGYLTSNLRKDPFSVVLFDEIEKAHPEIFDIFLQIFDEGRLTDGQGRRVVFSESIIILTSNIGSENYKQLGKQVNIIPNGMDRAGNIGIEEDKNRTWIEDGSEEEFQKKWRQVEENVIEEVSSRLRPEIMNRIQKIIVFRPLFREALKRIVQAYAEDLNMRLKMKGMQIHIGDNALELIVNKGYNEIYGAREMKRVFERLISEKLSKDIFEKKYKCGDIIKITSFMNEIQMQRMDA